MGDIPEGVQYCCQKCKLKHGRPDLRLSPSVIHHLSQYSWPGNVRELENAIERLVILSTGDKVTIEDLPVFARTDVPMQELFTLGEQGQKIRMVDVEKQLILQALEKFHGNQSRAARFLDMSRRTFAYRLEKYGISGETVKAIKRSA